MRGHVGVARAQARSCGLDEALGACGVEEGGVHALDDVPRAAVVSARQVRRGQVPGPESPGRCSSLQSVRRERGRPAPRPDPRSRTLCTRARPDTRHRTASESDPRKRRRVGRWPSTQHHSASRVLAQSAREKASTRRWHRHFAYMVSASHALRWPLPRGVAIVGLEHSRARRRNRRRSGRVNPCVSQPIVIERQVECEADVCTMWRAVTNTERLNRVAGMRPLRLKPNSDRTAARFVAKTVLGGFDVTFEEPPFEWREFESFEMLRKLRSGPATEVRTRFDFRSRERGSRVDVRVSVVPRHGVLRPIRPESPRAAASPASCAPSAYSRALGPTGS